MEIYESKNADGTLAIASRHIKAGELVLATKPLICCPNLDNIKSGTVCVGCLNTNNYNNSNSKEQQPRHHTAASSDSWIRCPLCTSPFCSPECYSRYCGNNNNNNNKSSSCSQIPDPESHHIRSGECAVIRSVLCSSSLHGLKSSQQADHLLMMTMLLAGRAWIAEKLTLPQEQQEKEEVSIIENDEQQQPKDVNSKKQIDDKEDQKDKMDDKKKKPPPKQTSQQLSAKEKAELKKKQKEEQKQKEEEETESSSSDDDDDDDEESNSSSDEEEPQTALHHHQSNNKKNSKTNNKNKNKSNKSSSASSSMKDKKKNAVAKAQHRASQNLAANTSSQMISQKMVADRKFIESKERTCLAKEYPEMFTAKSDENNNTTSTKDDSPCQWEPPFDGDDTANSTKKMTPLEYDFSLRKKAILQSPFTTFKEDFSKLISNANLLSKSEIASYETLRRKFNTVVNEVLSQLLLEEGDENHHENDKKKIDDDAEKNNNKFNVDKKFFYHVSSAYRCNTFGVFSSKDTQIGLAVYPTASYFNHSCSPNLLRRMEGGKCACFYAMRDIGKGEALTISYAGGFKSTLSRRQYLLENYRFFCRCELCRVADEEQQQEKGTKTDDGGKKTTKDNSNNNIKEQHQVIKQCSACYVEGYLRPVLVPSSSDGSDDDSSLPLSLKQVGLECESCFKFYPDDNNNHDDDGVKKEEV